MKFKIILVTALIGVVAFLSSRTSATHAQEAKVVKIVARKFSYEPATVTLKKGEPVTLVFTSEDVAHGLRFSDLNVNLKAKKDETTQVTITPEKIGDFVGHCSVFCGSGHGSMTVTLHVVD